MKNSKQEKPKQVESKPNGLPVHGPAGIALLFVCVSIGYANYVVFFGTVGLVPKIMLIPSTAFVALFLVIKAAK